MKKRTLLGFGAAATVLVVFITFVGWRDVSEAIRFVNPYIFSIGFLAAAISLVVRGMVWVLFIRLADPIVTRAHVLMLFLTAMFIKYVTPYGQVAAEPFIAYVVAEEGGLEYEEGFAGIATADFLNYIPYYTFGVVGFAYVLFFDRLTDDLGWYLVGITLLLGALVTLTAIVLFRRRWVRTSILLFARGVRGTIGRFSSRVHHRFKRKPVARRVGGFYDTVDLFRSNRRTVLLATTYAHIGMFFLLLPVYTTAIAAGVHIPFLKVAFIIALSKLGALFPAPGGLGGVEVTIVAAIYLLTPIDLVTATAITLLYRLCTYWFTIGVGGIVATILGSRG